jgi:hypothetical protein
LEPDLAFFRRHGRIRARPLTPTNRPLAAWEDLKRSDDAAILQHSRRARRFLLAQILRLLEPPFLEDVQTDPEIHAMHLQPPNAWKQFQQQLSTYDLRWDPKGCRYVWKKRTEDE